MADIEKVIKGLEQCYMAVSADEFETQCADCPYFEPYSTVEKCMTELREDAIGLLKEQEAVIEQYHKADGFLAIHGWKWDGR